MTSSVDPRNEIVAIRARLDGLTGVTVSGAPMGYEFPRDIFGVKLPYRDFESGSIIPSAGQRLLGANEQAQPYIWSFQVHHVAPSRDAVTALCIETDMSLIGWSPSAAATPISTFYFSMYDEFDKNGERVQWIATRFFETTLGGSPDLTM